MTTTTKIHKQVKHWTVTFEVEHYVNHGSFIDTVTSETRVGRFVSEQAARLAFWRESAEGVTPNGILISNVKGIRILHIEGRE